MEHEIILNLLKLVLKYDGELIDYTKLLKDEELIKFKKAEIIKNRILYQKQISQNYSNLKSVLEQGKSFFSKVFDEKSLHISEQTYNTTLEKPTRYEKKEKLVN